MTQELPEIGARIRLIEMPKDPCPIPPGTLGTVRNVNRDPFDGKHQIMVKWDIARSLMLVWGVDVFEIVTQHRVVVLEDNAYARYEVLVEATDPSQAAGIAREVVSSGVEEGQQHFREDGGLPYVTDVIDAQGEECIVPDEHEWFGVHAPEVLKDRATVAEVVRAIDAFDRQCSEGQGTDVGTFWELVYEWRKSLFGTLPGDVQSAITADAEAEERAAHDHAQHAMTVSA